MDVGEWLGGLGLGEYAKAFADNAIDAEVLPQLTADDLKELGVASLGHRRKLLTAIEALSSRKGGAAPRLAAESAGAPEMTILSAERRHLTVLFCDLVGSTALSARLDPEDFRDVIRRYHAVVAETVTSQQGFVAQYLGDGALIYFGFPAAHEDDAERAVRAALAVRKAAEAILVKGGSLQVRAGLATGLVVVGDRAEGSKAAHEPQVMGETPNRAARLQGLAAPGGIVIDHPTRRLVGRMFDLKERPAATLKGFETPVECWDVLGEAAIESRFEALRSGETPLVGREEELHLLNRRWQQAKTGSGRVVLISGEPGLGKSRLVSAFQERVKADGAIELRYFCSPQHSTEALYPIITHLSRTLKIADSDTPEQKLEKLRTIITKPEELPFVADLFSVEIPDTHFDELAPEERRQKVFDALSERMRALARKAPLFVLIEDTHWIDPTTQELMDHLVAGVGNFPVLVIVTCRPEYEPSWLAQPAVTALSLTRLGSEDCAALVRMLTAKGQLPADMVEKIAARTDGIPLFAEELSKALMDAGEKTIQTNASAAELQVPDTLHASLLARLDHLGAEARETAQAGSVIGREFSHGLITRMAAASGLLGDEKVETALRALVGSGLVFVRGAAPEATYTFKHSLVQDAAYSTLLRTQRQKLHATLAAMMERDGNVAPAILAYHFQGAGELDKAADQWFRAGLAANERSANVEALNSFQKALDAISSLPDTRERKLRALEITGAMCHPATAVNWVGSDSVEIANKAARLAKELEVSPPASVLYHQALHHIGSSGHKEAYRLFLLFREAAGPELQTRAESCLSTALYMSGGSLEEALDHSSRALAGYYRKAHSRQRFQYTYEPRCAALAAQSLQLTLRGYLLQAKAAERDGIEYAAEFAHPQTTGHQFAYKLLREEFQQDYSEQEETAAALMQHAREYKVPFWSLWTDIFRGFAEARNGRPLEGIEMIDRALKIFAEMKFTYYRPYHLELKARAYELAGDLDHALATISEAIAFAGETGETLVLADLIRLSGELRLARSGGLAVDLAERLFGEAIALAQAQASKLHELRAATSLARLLSKQGRDGDARKLLQPVHDWFTEGLDAPDLANARAVLRDLAASLPQHENA